MTHCVVLNINEVCHFFNCSVNQQFEEMWEKSHDIADFVIKMIDATPKALDEMLTDFLEKDLVRYS